MTFFISLLAYVLGLYFLKDHIVFSIIFSLVYFIFVFVRFSKKTFIVSFSIFLIGFGITKIPLTYNPSDNVFSGIVIESKENYFIFQSRLEKFYVYEKGNEREIGDHLSISGYASEIKMTKYESRFDFESYLNDKGIYRAITIKNVDEIYNVHFRRKTIINKFLNSFDDNSKSLLNAFLFNNKDYQNETIKIANEMNVVFLLSMSGIYISFLLGVSKKIFRLFLPDKLAYILPWILLLPYAAFVFTKIGILRVMVIYFLRFINTNIKKKKVQYLSIVSLTAFIFLILDYHLAYQETFYIGFALSFIIYFSRGFLKRYKKIKAKIYPIIIIYFFMLPIASFSKNEMHLFSLIFQAILLPINELYILTGLLSFYTIPFPHIINWMSGIISPIYSGLNVIDLKISFGEFHSVFFFFYYCLYFVALYLFESRQFAHIRNLSIPLVVYLTLLVVPVKNYFINAVYFINVGQGDSILIQNHQNTVLIDTGGNTSFDIADEVLIPFFKKKQINHIDYLIQTHNDADHNGGVTSLINNFKVYNFIDNNEQFPINIGSITLNNINSYKSDNDNDGAFVFNLEFMNKKFLLMSDVSKEVENYLINEYPNLSCDVLKVGHHGSKDSTSSTFLQKVKPKDAIISVGESNKYKHPGSETLSLLYSYGINVRRTDIEGTISYISI